MSSFFSTVPFLLFLYAAAAIGWWFGLRPIRERTKTEALYASSEVATQVDMGERRYIEYAMQPAPAAQPVAAYAAPDPPPPPPASAPPPPPGPAPAAVVAPPAPAAPAPPRADTPESLAARGDAPLSVLQYPSAVAAYDEALRLDPDRVPILLSKAGALAAIWISPAASIWVTSDPPLTKTNWTSRPYLSKNFLSLPTHSGVLWGSVVETAILSRVLGICAWEGQAVPKVQRNKSTKIDVVFISIPTLRPWSLSNKLSWGDPKPGRF